MKRTHGHTSRTRASPKVTSEYSTWAQMIQRCHNENCTNYHKYGAKGIAVCQRWRDSFEAFLEDVGRKPTKRHTLDRYPNRGGNYEPGNVRWALPKEQARNTRRNIRLTWKGETLTVPEWADRTGISAQQIRYRVFSARWTPEKALTTPVRAGQKTTKRSGRRLSDNEVREIRQMAADGTERSKIAMRLGVAITVIHKVIQRKSYQKVGEK